MSLTYSLTVCELFGFFISLIWLIYLFGILNGSNIHTKFTHCIKPKAQTSHSFKKKIYLYTCSIDLKIVIYYYGTHIHIDWFAFGFYNAKVPFFVLGSFSQSHYRQMWAFCQWMALEQIIWNICSLNGFTLCDFFFYRSSKIQIQISFVSSLFCWSWFSVHLEVKCILNDCQKRNFLGISVSSQ